MSTWRDIWRYGVIANRLYAEDSNKGIKAFRKLSEVYPNDGMIHFIYAESLERSGLLKPAEIEYKKAEELFPVPHWKDVAKNSIKRINKKIINYDSDFEKKLWESFHEVFSLVYLNDFARYVSLSALARGSSEWPLSLVNFRTVLELEIKQCFPEVIEEFNDENRYSLRVAIERLYETNKIDEYRKNAFHDIRKAGNIAAHELYPDTKFKYQNLNNFITVLRFLNEYRYNHLNKKSQKLIAYPLCQLSLPDFLLIPDEVALSDIKKY